MNIIPNRKNVSGIKIFRAQFQSLQLRKEMLNAANIYLLLALYTHQMQIYIQIFYNIYLFIYCNKQYKNIELMMVTNA